MLLLSGVVKLIALLVGGALTLLALMSLIGTLTDNGWARIGGAVLIAIVVPAFFADRALPRGSETKKGIVTDVFAMFWLGFAVLYGVVAGSFTGGLLRAEAVRLDEGGLTRSADMARWLAGSGDEEPSTVAQTNVTDAGAPEAKPDKTDNADAAASERSADAGATQAKTDEDGERKTDKLTPAELFKKWAPSVVTIQTGTGRRGASGGTGFIVDSNGLVVTNHHVIAGGRQVSVKLMDGSWASKVELLLDDADLDVAVLQIYSDKRMQAVSFGDSDKVTVGEKVVSIGNPLGLEHTLTDGLVSARRQYRGKQFIQVSAPVSPGNSGGPLFDATGKVIGVTTASLSTYGMGENLNLAVPTNLVTPKLEGKFPDRKRIGGGSPVSGGRW